MSRDIKFRAWHTYHKFMFQVMEVTCDAQYASGFSRVVAYPFDDWNKSENERGEWANNAPRARTHYLHHEIDNLELMQFTGLKDKNGRDIYEGDIVYSDRYNARFEVKWCNGKGEFLRSQVGWMLDDTRFCPVGHTVEFEAHLEVHEADREEYFNGRVIGNIYEHPELIERKSHEQRVLWKNQ